MPDFSDILLTVDYDRTLTGPDSVVPERNIEAIRYFMENGGTFTVNTGRSVPMARPFMDIVPVNAPLLLYNGSAAYDTKEKRFTFAYPIGLEMEKVVETCQKNFPDMTVEVQGVDAHYCFAENPGWAAYNVEQNCVYRFADKTDDLSPFVKFTLYGEFRSPLMKDMYLGSEEEIRRIDDVEVQLRRLFGEYCEVFRAAPRVIDIQTKGVSKARSARELQKHLGKKWLVCVGDAENDISMLEEADFAFVPSDAILAKRFPNVCKCGEGAVADVIYEKIPEILANNP